MPTYISYRSCSSVVNLTAPELVESLSPSHLDDQITSALGILQSTVIMKLVLKAFSKVPLAHRIRPLMGQQGQLMLLFFFNVAESRGWTTC